MNPDHARLTAARTLLTQLGVTLDDLATHPESAPACPTVDEYVPLVIAAAGAGARRT